MIERIFAVALIVVLGSVSGCALPQKKQASAPISADREQLFPNGTYKHNVRLELEQAPNPEKPDEKRFDLKGLAQVQPEMIKVVGLSPFGTTLFKITENRATGEINVETYVDSLKRVESKIRDYYSVLRHMMIAPMKPGKRGAMKLAKANSDGLPEVVDLKTRDESATLKFENYDKNKIPQRIQITHPRFKVDVEVAGYEV